MLQGGDTLLLELTKLKVSNGQLEDALKEVNEATHRYLFWTSDVRPMTIAWPLEIAQDLRRLISLDTFSQLGKASVMMLTSKETILPLFGALILVGCSIYSRRYFTRFLERSAAKVGKVTQDHFWLTLRTLFWSNSRRVTVTGAVDDAGLRLARGVALSAGGRDWRWCNGPPCRCCG